MLEGGSEDGLEGGWGGWVEESTKRWLRRYFGWSMENWVLEYTSWCARVYERVCWRVGWRVG